METFWDANSKIIREQYPGLLEEILKKGDAPVADYKIESAACGAPTLAINGLYVHSNRDPHREAQRLAQALVAENEKPQAVVVLGFGLGYAAQAAAELFAGRPVIIIEKNISLLRIALEARDLSSLLSRPGIAFLPGESGTEIAAVLSLFVKKGLAEKGSAPLVMRNRTLAGIDEQWYAAVENNIRSWAMRDTVNAATLNKFGRRWMRNFSRNMNAIRDLPGISRLEGLANPDAKSAAKSAPFPVFLAAAGPGLDEAAPLLAEIHQRCIIVAVDTSLRFLLRHGIEPDFALVIDPQFWNSRHLNRCASEHTRLIVESSTYPPVLRLPFKEMYLCGSLYPLGIFIEQRVDPKGALGAGGSVATSAWDFARMLGAQEIWIAGLDLAFPAGKTHFRGAQFEEKALNESGRLNPVETWLFHALRDGIPYKAPALSGGEVLSDRRLSLYASWFENRFRQFPHICNYSLSSGGLAIPGLQAAGTEALLALQKRRAELNRRIETVFLQIETDFFNAEELKRRAIQYEKASAALASGLQKIQSSCAKGIKIAAHALRQGQADRGKTLADLDEVNGFITGSEVKEIAGFLIPQHLLHEMDATQAKNENTAFTAYLKSSIKLYESLAVAADAAGLKPNLN